MNIDISNAKITNVSISMEDHGCLTFGLTLEGDGWGCVFGGYKIGSGYLGSKIFEGSAIGLESMMRIMDTVGVSRWEDLNGKYVRVKNNGCGTSIKCIGNIVKNKWFDIEDFFKQNKR